MAMKTILFPFLLLLLFLPGQEEKKTPPELPPLRKGAEKKGKDAPPERTDLIQRFPTRNPLLGVWQVSPSAGLGSGTGTRTSGYLVITESHISMHLWKQSLRRDPVFQTSMRTYQIQGPRLITTSLMGVRSGVQPGELLLEKRGLRETRRFQLLLGKTLRIYQGASQYLDFIRISER